MTMFWPCSLHDCDGEDLSKNMSRLVNFITTKNVRNVALYKENLPAKCLKADYLNSLWIQAPVHDRFTNNALRFKFNTCLDEIAKLPTNVFTLVLKKVWGSKGWTFIFIWVQQIYKWWIQSLLRSSRQDCKVFWFSHPEENYAKKSGIMGKPQEINMFTMNMITFNGKIHYSTGIMDGMFHFTDFQHHLRTGSLTFC